MKITKTKQVEVEEVEIQDGIYYFIDMNGTFNKYTIMQEEEGITDYFEEQVINNNKNYSIKFREGYTCEEDDVPYYLKIFILGISGKKIEKEEFEQQKQEVIKRLC